VATDDEATSASRALVRGSSSSSTTSGGVVGGNIEGENTAETSAEDNQEKSEEAESSGLSAKKKLNTDEELGRGQRGCADMDLVTLLKLVAIVAILLIVGAIALSNRGKNKSQN
jgi:hypothetical protein